MDINELRSDDVDQLNAFLRGERAAVETYGQALESADHPHAHQILRQNQQSHEQRVALLEAAVRDLGAEPAASSGAWGTFAQAVEGGAKLFGSSAAIAALEQGEDHGLSDYEKNLDELSLGCRRLVETRLLPEQHRTHDALAQLKALQD